MQRKGICPKCGHYGLSPRHQADTHDRGDVLTSILRFTCPCGYTWVEEANDAQVKP